MATQDELRIQAQQLLQESAALSRQSADKQFDASEILGSMGTIVDGGVSPTIHPRADSVVNLKPYSRAVYQKVLGDDVRITWEQGLDSLSVAGQLLKADVVPDSGGSTRAMVGGRMAGGKEFSLYQTLQLPDDFEFGGTGVHKGGKLGFGLAAANEGNKPGGGSYNPHGFTVRHMWRQEPRTGDKPVLVLYSYTADDPEVKNRDTYSDYELIPGVAHKLHTRVRVNDRGQSNGWFSLAAGGRTIAERRNVFFMEGEPTIDEFLMQFFYGGNNELWSPTRLNTICLAEVGFQRHA